MAVTCKVQVSFKLVNGQKGMKCHLQYIVLLRVILFYSSTNAANQQPMNPIQKGASPMEQPHV